MNSLVVFTDGGARGNPGPAAIGVVIQDEKGDIVKQFAKKIESATNNVAEYMAVIEALKWIVCHPEHSEGSHWDSSAKPQNDIIFFLDSKLVVNQLNGLFKIKNANLRELLFKVRELEADTKAEIHYQLIPREKNQLADRLLNEALDS